ncbi:MAG TPA: patatin-like phospholipase family protein [Streptosporangiaceae bacterium]|nr:patatin-like phospholipase family protein [Streptosporangiaceae bacterium]
MGDDARQASAASGSGRRSSQRPRGASGAATLEQQAQQYLGADLVLEGGGVKGIGLVGAVMTIRAAGYVFPRPGGTSAGAIVAALIAAYQSRGVDLSRLERDMRELDYTQFMEKTWAERHLGIVGKAAGLLEHQGVYATGYLQHWLTAKLEPLGVRTFADLKITDDAGTGLPPRQRYRLVTHTSDLSRGSLVRLPWDLPYYLLSHPETASPEEQIAAIDSYPVVDAVRASMSIPFFFQPFTQKTPRGSCTWVDGGLLQNFPVTVFDRTDGRPNRWPTFGVKLSARPRLNIPDVPVTGDIKELLAIAHTAMGEWNRYPLADAGVGARTVYVDTMGLDATDFGITQQQRDQLFENGSKAAVKFLAAWDAAHSRQP